ncbi:MAG: AI-2E family transporter [Mizugakiibacter sp.]|uniref:AI-2E family transporter n=1 Tax=Mizugakiibacter sp. TaxID=1972610 RepID=UPI0031C1CCBF|nr:AI-2E family transporter [Xanthomonadaceae bacterium]
MDHPRPQPPSAFRIAAWLLAFAALLLVLRLHLLSAILAGLLVFQLVHVLAPLLQRRLTGERARLIAVALLAGAIVGLLTLAIVAVSAFFRSDTGGLQVLFGRMVQILDQVRSELPASVVGYLPEDTDTLRRAVVEWLSTHGQTLQLAGKEAVQTFVHVLAGMVLGALIALHEVRPAHRLRPLARELLARSAHFAEAFRRIVFAQIKISFVNTAFTALFLLAILPLAGVYLPLAKTMIAVTFVVGLLPVIGNLVSNTVIAVIALSVSPYVALAALAFLVVIHKLEYFLNARIVGNEIHARAWELLLAMLVMEAAFGLPGLVAAPIYYAYVKRELADQGWV